MEAIQPGNPCRVFLTIISTSWELSGDPWSLFLFIFVYKCLFSCSLWWLFPFFLFLQHFLCHPWFPSFYKLSTLVPNGPEKYLLLHSLASSLLLVFAIYLSFCFQTAGYITSIFFLTSPLSGFHLSLHPNVLWIFSSFARMSTTNMLWSQSMSAAGRIQTSFTLFPDLPVNSYAPMLFTI